jgi:hypothetical protein
MYKLNEKDEMGQWKFSPRDLLLNKESKTGAMGLSTKVMTQN